ncbi:hypothetical protein HYS91_03835 [Candidatus Daviesbacteria bacterium]|nr:hypothetical protein [Candidatus Daviesbacteria bacterium]
MIEAPHPYSPVERERLRMLYGDVLIRNRKWRGLREMSPVDRGYRALELMGRAIDICYEDRRMILVYAVELKNNDEAYRGTYGYLVDCDDSSQYALLLQNEQYLNNLVARVSRGDLRARTQITDVISELARTRL